LFNKFFESKEIKQLKARAQSMPNDPEVCFNLGTAYQKLGRYKDAVCEFEKTLKYNPMSAEAYYNLALIYENMNEGKKATLHILKAGNLFSNKNDQVNKMEARGLLRQYYRKFNIQPEDLPEPDSDI